MNETQTTLQGGCTCGLVRYRLLQEPLFVHCCHCSWCRRETGSAFAINAMIESKCLERSQGEPELRTIPSLSGKGQKVARCPECRVALWSHYAGAGDMVSFVRAGTLDDPGQAPPDIHIFTSSKLPWVVLPADVPAVPEFYQISKYWPENSLQRRRVLQESAG